jgi:hypothetical protein
MELADACEVLESLASGLDPLTGAALPESSPLHHARVVRALYTALLHLSKPATGVQLPGKAGKPWDAAEDARLLAAFDAGVKIPELAARHQRTRGAIQSRLIRLGRLQAPQEGSA